MVKQFCTLIFKLKGWTLDRNMPEGVDRCVLLGVPHTSNWDGIYTIASTHLLGVPMRFTVKDELMKFPFGWFVRSGGGIGINRRPKKEGEQRKSMTQAMIDLFAENEKLAIVVTPEGTRSKRTEWKTGFYHVARGAGVPIGLSYVDFKNKKSGVGKVIDPSDKTLDEVMRIITDFYRDANPKYPEKFSLDLRYI